MQSIGNLRNSKILIKHSINKVEIISTGHKGIILWSATETWRSAMFPRRLARFPWQPNVTMAGLYGNLAGRCGNLATHNNIIINIHTRQIHYNLLPRWNYLPFTNKWPFTIDYLHMKGLYSRHKARVSYSARFPRQFHSSFVQIFSPRPGHFL